METTPRINSNHSPKYNLFLLGLLEVSGHILRDTFIGPERPYVFERDNPKHVAVWQERKDYAETGVTYRQLCDKYPDVKAAWERKAEARRNWRNLRCN